MNLTLDYALRSRETAISSPKNFFSETITKTPSETLSGTQVFPDATDSVELSLGTITAGEFLYLKSDIDIEVFVGATSTTPQFGTLHLISITDVANAFSEIHVRNNNGEMNDATVEYLIAGDTPSS